MSAASGRVRVSDLADLIKSEYFRLSDAQLTNKVKALVFKSGVWGVPIGIFFHMNELAPHQVGVLLDALKESGATLMTNTQLVEYLSGAQPDVGTTYFADAATGDPPDFRPSMTQ